MEPGLMIRADVPNTANRLGGYFFDGYYAQPGLFFDDRLKGPRFWKHGDFVLLLERYDQSTIWWKALHLRSQTVIFLQDINLQYFWQAGPDECAFDSTG